MTQSCYFREPFTPTWATIILFSPKLLTTLYPIPTLKAVFAEIRGHLTQRFFVLNWNRIFVYSLLHLLMLIKTTLTIFFRVSQDNRKYHWNLCTTKITFKKAAQIQEKPWITAELLSTIQQKRKLYRSHSLNGDDTRETDLQKFC